ncbi:outer membrane protein [Limoniibacter endophyticus]|uniref:Outer membrane protein n=1 Tax=Limoniibacter endophyticus TaxID=1565040 RepID=A0A8J3GH06_9HYPH|nr:porin family protein [Limoniibacter endophyticus]GHC68468.1 outer membrane protein [Limoniibacter endophyticus]
MKKLLIAALVAASGSAQAADVVYNTGREAPIAQDVARVYSWEGAYVGATVGYAKGEANIVPGQIYKDSGVAYGGFAGYNFDLGHGFIAGVEAGIGGNEFKARAGGNTFATSWNYDASVRLGYAFDNALIYGSVGYGVQDLNLRIPDTVSKGKSDGLIYGVGVDYALTDHVFTRLNYQYRDFRSNLVNVETKEKVGKMDLDQHFVGVGVGYKF